ncbi:MAG: hypothetical protein LBE91_08195 [Tannerella sp.]|jgi:hypothetical protein|nr:hypothetical protein [Tannerella sp.]
MIFKTEDGRAIVIFGGDIIVALGRNIPTNVPVIFGQIPDNLLHNPSKIGDSYEEYKEMRSTDFINPIEFHFNRVESIDVVIEKLNEARNKLLEQ